MIAWVPAVVYVCAIFALSSMSHPPTPPFHVWDKLAHAVLYTGLGLTVAWGLTGGGRWVPGWKTVLGATVLALLYGISDEIHQLFVPNRTCEIGDVQADLIGGFLGAVGVWCWTVLRRRRQRETPLPNG